jgi:signal transduction histidine kinase
MENISQSVTIASSPITFGPSPAGNYCFGPRRNGDEPRIDPSIFKFEAADKKLSAGALKALAELAWIHDEHGAYAAAANTVREQEKTRVARELHDELAQPLTALKMDTIWVRDNLFLAPEAAAAKLGEMVEMLDRTVAATRRIASDLRPLLLDDLGLVPAVEWLVKKFTQHCGVACTLAVDETLELQEPHATAVFRIIQESLANVAKHAVASKVAVTIEKLQGEVTLSVHDNGCGFSLAAPRRLHSLGILGLRERVQLLKGTLIIESAQGQGTCVRVSIPLPRLGAGQ